MGLANPGVDNKGVVGAPRAGERLPGPIRTKNTPERENMDRIQAAIGTGTS